MKRKNPVVERWQTQTDPEVLKSVRSLLSLGIASVGADEGSLLIYDNRKHNLVFTEVAGRSPKDITGKTIQLGDGVTGNAALLREMQIGSRLVNEQMRDVEGDGHPFSVLAAPVLLADELWGCITAVRFSEGATFSSQDGEVYLHLAAVLGCMIGLCKKLEISAGEQEDVPSVQNEELNLIRKFSGIVSRNPDKKESISVLLNGLDGLI